MNVKIPLIVSFIKIENYDNSDSLLALQNTFINNDNDKYIIITSFIIFKKIIMFIIKQAVEIHVVEKIFNLTEQISAIKCFN